MSWISVGDSGIDRVMRLETIAQAPGMESLQARVPIAGDIKSNSRCWLHVDGRAVKPQIELGLGRLAISVRTRDDQRSALLERSIYLEPDWTAIDVSFVTGSDLDGGEAEIVFGVGTQSQVIELSDISMRCFEEDAPFTRLPETAFSYRGREPEAPWREMASSHIERYRKGDLTIDVTDSNGRPVANAEIHVQMIRHAFQFGASIDAEKLVDDGDEAGQSSSTAAFRKNLGELFNTVTFDKDLRWTAWNDPVARERTEAALAWTRSLGLTLQGRGLAFSGFTELPAPLQENSDDPQAVRDAIRTGVTSAAVALQGQVGAWDVVASPRGYRELLDVVGVEEMAGWYRLLREADPEATLVLSESDLLAGDRMSELAAMVGEFIDREVPIDQLGAHGRFDTQPPPIQVLSDRLDQLASFGLPIVITGFDIATPEEALASDFTRDFLTLAFSHPSVEGFTFEHFFEGDDEETKAALYRRDGAVSPLGQIYRDLVLGRWWSDVVALSNAEGQLTSRVFQGDYSISVRKDGQTASVMLTVGADGASVSLELAAAAGGESERTN
jgi:GH35 family endo-1,4-beta-xylanase